MKRDRKYYKELPKGNLMNGLKHILLLLGIGILFAQDIPEEFQYEVSTQRAWYFFDSVTINGDIVDADDWVGAFNGDICVGLRKWDTSACGSGVCDLPVMGDDGSPETEGYMNLGDFPTFKIYDASAETTYVAIASEDLPWSHNGDPHIGNLNGGIFGCTNSNACNYDEDATIEDDSCLENDCAGECGGSSEVDDCGECGGDGTSCAVYVEASVTITVDENVLEDVEFEDNFESLIETQLLLPEGSVKVTNIAILSRDNLEIQVDFTITLTEEELAETNFESTDDIEDAWSEVEEEISNEGIEFIDGCTDPEACNYDENATIGDDSCLESDCAGVCSGGNYYDNCGDCDDDPANDCICVSYDDCGVCNGDNTDCWFIDISTSIGEIVEENISQIGMHIAASDDFNADYVPGYTCDNCYKDKIEDPFHEGLNNYVDSYFPHPEWAGDIPPLFNSTSLRNDIRSLDIFELPDLDNNSTIFVNETIYYIQHEWEIMIDTDQDISLPWIDDVKLEFNFINQIPNYGFTKVFFYKEELASGNKIIEEITSESSDDNTCLSDSDHCIKLEDYDLFSNFKIILGTDTVMPSATIVSPLPNTIFALEDDNFNIQLDLDNPEMIQYIDLFFEVDNEISPAISVDVDESIEVQNDEYFGWLNGKIGENFNKNVNIYIEITDVAGGTADEYNGKYRSDLGPFTFSRNSISLAIETGWNLLAPPVQQQENLYSIFNEDAFGCTLDDCPIITTANSGTGFYMRSYGDDSNFTFTGQVLSDFSTNLESGWNLIGNPLVTSVDINTVNFTYNGLKIKWPEASKHGWVSPTPIIYDIYDNENGGHIGTELLPSGAGFWLYSYHDNVKISFIPSTTAEEIEASNYWNLSLFAIEDNANANDDDRIGSEIVIGIHEDANNAIVDGEDQEILPFSGMNLFDYYSDISINNDGQTSLYKDIRSFHETSITWNVEVKTAQYNSDEGTQFTWKFSENIDPYDYSLDIGEDITINMKDNLSYLLSHNDFLSYGADMSITAKLKEEYIGCTDPEALNYNMLANGTGEYCTNGTCLGGNRDEFCANVSLVSLVLPETYAIDQDLPEFVLPISLDNPQGIGIEGLQFILKYDAAMVQLFENGVAINEDLNGYYLMEQGLCTDCIPAELSVNIYFVGLKEDFTDENENYIWDEGEPFVDFNGNDIYDDASFNGEDQILTLSGKGLPNTGTTTISFSSVQINESVNAFGNSCEISMNLDFLSVSGKIIYYSTGFPVSGGLISITEADNLSNIHIDYSNENGTFIVDLLDDDKTYKLLLEKDKYDSNLDNYFDGLSAVDASRIARHSINKYPFSEREKIAANVNFDYRCEDENEDPIDDIDNESQCDFDWVPNIEAGDAVLVAKYAAGINPYLNQDCDPHWVFIDPNGDLMINAQTCEDIPYEIDLEASMSDLNFDGLRLGDVTGNWTAPLSRENDENIVENPIVEVEVGQIIKLPLYLPNKVEIEGLDFTIQFDPEVFTLIGFNNNNSILDKSYNTIINDDTPGMFKLVSYANSVLINDNGLLGYIKFKVIGNSTRWSSISINEIKINDIQEGGFLVEGNFESSSITYGFDFQISVVPEVFALNKNYPNPFNPRTNIKFELPDDGDVQIFIYDLKGSLIDELANGYMEAGYHNLKWDGSHKASGVYFIQMIADNGNYIKMTKMMLVK